MPTGKGRQLLTGQRIQFTHVRRAACTAVEAAKGGQRRCQAARRIQGLQLLLPELLAGPASCASSQAM
ncbi:hypothetical protein EJJ20_26030 [Pseudomonas poae]|nr:hypothetical protein EJJ20_26030 [Pseudomonas poae]